MTRMMTAAAKLIGTSHLLLRAPGDRGMAAGMWAGGGVLAVAAAWLRSACVSFVSFWVSDCSSAFLISSSVTDMAHFSLNHRRC